MIAERGDLINIAARPEYTLNIPLAGYGIILSVKEDHTLVATAQGLRRPRHKYYTIQVLAKGERCVGVI
jgi:hypothetical protein